MYVFRSNYHNVFQNSSCSTSLPIQNLVSFLLYCCLAILMAYLIDFNLHFSNKMLSTFHVHVLLCHPYIFSGEVLQIFYPFFYGVIGFLLDECWAVWALYTFRIQVLCLTHDLQILGPFSPILVLSFHSLECLLQSEFWWSPIYYFFYGACFWCWYLITLCLIQGNKDFLFYPKYFIVFHFTFRSVIDLQLIFT